MEKLAESDITLQNTQDRKIAVSRLLFFKVELSCDQTRKERFDFLSDPGIPGVRSMGPSLSNLCAKIETYSSDATFKLIFARKII